jgi:hypothetical protein
MKPLITEAKQKILSSVLATIISFLGFEVLSFVIGSTYQLGIYMRLAIYFYAFHFLWLTFLFDLHFKKRGVLANLSADHKGLDLFIRAIKDRVKHMFDWHYFRHYLNFLILPGVIFWSVVCLIAINPFDSPLKQSIIAISTVCLGVTYWYFKEIFRKNFELHHFGIKILTLTKFVAAFLFFAAIIGFSFYFDLGPVFLFFSVFTVTFLLVYQALFQHRLLDHKVFLTNFLIAAVTAAVSFWIYEVWNWYYLTAGLILLAVYNTCWGILHHYLDNNLTKRLAWEYLFLLFLALSILLASHNFSPHIE